MILEINGLYKSFPHAGTGQIEVLKNLNLEVQEGETVAVVGPSGSGKSPLFSLLSFFILSWKKNTLFNLNISTN